MNSAWGGTGENWLQRRRDDHDVRQIGLSGSIQIRQEDGMEESISTQVEYPIDLGCTSGCPSKTATHSGNLLNRFYTFSIARAGGRSLLRSRDERQFLEASFLKCGVLPSARRGRFAPAPFWRRIFIGPLPGRPERPLPGLALLGSKPPNYNQFNRLPV